MSLTPLVAWPNFFKLQSVFILPSKAKDISPEQIDATLLANNYQHCWISFMLRLFAHPVACYVLSGVVAQSLKPVKLLATCKRTQQLPTMLDQHCWELFEVVRQQCCVRLLGAYVFSFRWQNENGFKLKKIGPRNKGR